MCSTTLVSDLIPSKFSLNCTLCLVISKRSQTNPVNNTRAEHRHVNLIESIGVGIQLKAQSHSAARYRLFVLV